MAPIKRHRSTEDEGETEILDVESASSSLQQASVSLQSKSPSAVLTTEQRKKPRVSYDASDHPNSDSDDAAFLQQATQFSTQQRIKAQAKNAPAENGIIEMVTCINFMCHEHLEIALGPLINFIIGQNGSGKSAVLTAITICLGGKASSTNRGQSLKSFIKEGQEYVKHLCIRTPC